MGFKGWVFPLVSEMVTLAVVLLGLRVSLQPVHAGYSKFQCGRQPMLYVSRSALPETVIYCVNSA